jgi:hypothetical protein
MILLIPDIHLRHKEVDRIIKHEQPKKVLFKGDHFDQYDDSVAANREAALWLKTRMKQHPEDEFIWGNHDTSYGWSSRWTKCSGYTLDKDIAINDILGREEWDRFKFYTWLNEHTLVSHAGLHWSFIMGKLGSRATNAEIQKWLEAEAKIAYMTLCHGGSHWMYGAGRARGGLQNMGGLNWLDWNEEFEPIPGIDQIVGHTVLRSPDKKEAAESVNWNLDTNGTTYGIWNGNKLEVKYAPDEIPNWNQK